MIRIDEIYSNTFWPWIKKNLPGMRMFFCDPFGHTQKENLYNFGDDNITERSFVYFHDQEPIQFDTYRPLFSHVVSSNFDLISNREVFHDTDFKKTKKNSQFVSHVVVSEKGENLKKLTDTYSWIPHYYFFHGWACLDWYRGYNYTFLFPPPSQRDQPRHSFMCPNRIMGGERDHRVLFLYHTVRASIANAKISCPRLCPDQQTDILDLCAKYAHRYPDIQQVLEQADLPWNFEGESGSPMSSCWLTNFEEATNSLVYVPTETVYFGKRLHLTEKTFKAITLGMPFVLVATAGSLEYLRSYGFKTFGGVWNEDYDLEQDDFLRLEKIVALLKDLDSSTPRELEQIRKACLPAVQHNWDHFYHGGFEKILWQELQTMLHGLHF